MVTDKDAYIQQGFLYAPFGEIIAEYGWQSSNVPKYAFNAKELDEENNMYYYSARYYAPPTFISRDPMFEEYPFFTPYHYCKNNPMNKVDPTGMFDEDPSVHIDKFGNVLANYDDGDNSVYLHEDASKTEVEAQYSQNNTSAGGKKIGELGSNINTNGIMKNKLVLSLSKAIKMKIVDYYYAVKKDGDWDLKDNTNTIWGVAWAYDKENKTNTIFSFGGYTNMNSADVGNYHAGFTGRFVGVIGLPKYLLCKGAGFAETLKEWQDGSKFMAIPRANQLLTPINLQSGDRTRDFYWNTTGMQDADNLKRR
jgi:RHS repeat-associated protein